MAKGLGDDPLKKKGSATNIPDAYSGVYFRTNNEKAAPAKETGLFGKLKHFFGGN